MSEPKTLARPYAIAVYRFAQQEQELDAWSVMLANLRALVLNDSIQKMLHQPMIETETWLKILQPVMKNYLGTHGVNFLRLLIANHRLELAPMICELFEKIKAEADNIVDVTITTAITLNDVEQQKLVDTLAQQLQQKISPHFHVDDAIIAGAIFSVGEKYVVDGSLASQLTRLKTKFQS